MKKYFLILSSDFTALFIYILFLTVMMISCSLTPPSALERTQYAEQLAGHAGWEKILFEHQTLPLAAFVPKYTKKISTLTIYIEGDGLAWISSSRPSKDPTPRRPISLQLALKDTNDQAVYLGRACQYVDAITQPSCHKHFWTRGRFSSEVLESTQHAINVLKAKFSAQELQLIGYSGGAAIAALIASQRDDVVRLITIAGNLDHEAWTRKLKVTPLSDSLNPADVWEKLLDIPQVHFVGGDDRIVDKVVIESYTERFPDGQKPTVHTVENFTHSCCWVERWPELLHNYTMSIE